MFEKFGEFDSAEEICRAAAAQLAEGDVEAIRILAQENGLDPMDVEDYIEGEAEELCTPSMAAVGKLTAEKKELGLTGALEEFVEELFMMCEESREYALAIRRKGKRLDEYLARVVDYAFEHTLEVPKQITDRTKKVKGFMNGHALKMGVPSLADRERIAEEYYLGEEK